MILSRCPGCKQIFLPDNPGYCRDCAEPLHPHPLMDNLSQFTDQQIAEEYVRRKPKMDSELEKALLQKVHVGPYTIASVVWHYPRPDQYADGEKSWFCGLRLENGTEHDFYSEASEYDRKHEFEDDEEETYSLHDLIPKRMYECCESSYEYDDTTPADYTEYLATVMGYLKDRGFTNFKESEFDY